MQSSYRKIEGFAARVIPALLTFFIALLMAIPMHGAVLGTGMTPAIVLICIFYWGVYSPGVLPYSFLFLLGIVQDALSGQPLGLSSFVNMGFAYLLHSQRKLMGRALFGTVWVSCALLIAMATLVQWAIISLYVGKAYPLAVPLMRWVVTCIAYPPLHVLFTQVYKRLRNYK